MRNTIFLLPLFFMAWQPVVKSLGPEQDYLPNPVPVPRHQFTVIAHRGDHVSLPENTLAAYEQAIEDGADYVEIDLRTTKDGELLSMHNDQVDRTTNGKGLVKDLLWADIEKLTVNGSDDSKKMKIPSFKEILSLCKNRIYIYIDFKAADPAAVMPLLKQYGMEKQVLVYINSAEQFKAWRKAGPEIPLMLSLPKEVKDSAGLSHFINTFQPDLLDGDFRQYHPQLVAAAESRHIPVWPDGQSKTEGPGVWDQVLQKGLSGLQTDHPRELISYLQHKGLRPVPGNNRTDTLVNIFLNHPEQIMVAAHRCAHANFPENSLSALKEAIRLGTDIAEIDVRQTKDHVLVVMHDAKVDRSTNGKGELAAYTYPELQALRLLYNGKPTVETVPTLEQFLLAAKGKILVDLDFKAGDQEALKQTYHIIEKTQTANQVLFFLYGSQEMAMAHQLNPEIRLMPRAYNAADLKNIMDLNLAAVIHIDESFYSDQLMKTLSDSKLRIWSNSLGKYDDLEEASKSGFSALLKNTPYVNIIQTNLPEEWLQYLKKAGLHQ